MKRGMENVLFLKLQKLTTPTYLYQLRQIFYESNTLKLALPLCRSIVTTSYLSSLLLCRINSNLRAIKKFCAVSYYTFIACHARKKENALILACAKQVTKAEARLNFSRFIGGGSLGPQEDTNNEVHSEQEQTNNEVHWRTIRTAIMIDYLRVMSAKGQPSHTT